MWIGRAGYCRPPGRYRARQIPDRPDRLPVGRYHCRLADQRRGAGESRRCGYREQDIVARQGDIERAKSQIALIDSQLADTIAVSPINGVVLVKAADVGEVL